MLATILCLGLFAYFSVVGYALLSLLSDEEPLYLLLLSPVTGAAVVMLLTFTGNQFGAPILSFGLGLVLLTLIGAPVVLWRRGRPIKIRDVWPYLVLICFGLLMTGWPMLRFGLDWVSFCNDDMANYSMGVARVLHRGYSELPDGRALTGEDYTQYLWYLHLLHRPGSEMILALVSAVTRVSPLRIFMPTILAFMLCQISAAGAMAYAAIRSRTAVWLTMLLVALSALGAFGALYQLIAQVIGLAMLAGLTSVLMRPADEWFRGGVRRQGILIGVLTTGLVFCYSELLPFVAVGFGLYILLNPRVWRAHLVPSLRVLGIGALVLVLLLNRYLPFAVAYVLFQLGKVPSESPATTLFPYYMMPSGPVYFWGIHPLGMDFPQGRSLTILVVTSLLVSAAAGLLVLRSAWRRQAPAIISVVMVGVFVFLFSRHSGFRMYKLAMYLQPFVLTAVVVGWISLWRWRIVQVLPLIALAALGLRSQSTYVRASLTEGSGSFTEIPGASGSHIVREYADLLAAHPDRPLEIDTYNLVLAKFQMIESRGRPALLPSNDFLYSMWRFPLGLMSQESGQWAIKLRDEYYGEYPNRRFDMHAQRPEQRGFNRFRLDLLGAQPPSVPVLFVATTGRQAPFNRWHDPEEVGGNFRCGNIDEFQNHLIFVASHLGQPYYYPGPQQSAIYQLENDLLFPNRTMSGVGRYLLFETIKPSSKVRVELSLTDSLAGDREDRLPPAEAIGTDRLSVPMIGRGSARVISDPLTPQMIDGRYYVAIDMGTNGTFFNYSLGGLMQLWGRDVRFDHRQMVAFLRDVSLVSEDQYRAIVPPSAIRHFPDDLMDRNVEYSGIYEDGWLGDHAYLILSQTVVPSKIVCKLVVPRIKAEDFSTDVILQVDGKEVARKTVKLGDVDLSADLPPGAGRRRIGLAFSKLQNFADPDGRPIGAKVLSIGIEPASAPAH